MIKPKYLKYIGAALLSLTITACSGIQKQSQNAPQPQQPQQPQQPAVEQKAAYYYTANEGGSITKIDASTNRVIASITVNGSAHNVQVSPDGKVVGATVAPDMEGKTEHGTMSMKNLAVFYDSETDKLIKEVEVGEHPAHIVFTHDGSYALVTNNEGNNVSVIDMKNYTVVNTIPTGKGPHGFRISKDNKLAYVANMDEDTVSVLDISSFKELRKIKVGKTPVTTGITSDGKTLVATSNAENTLAIVDLDTDKVEKIPVGAGPAQVYIQNDDKYAFVANQGTEKNPSNTVTKIDLTTRKVAATIFAGKGTHGVVTSDDNKYVYVTNMYENTVSVIDNDQNKVVAIVAVGKTPNGISFRGK